MAFWHRKKEDLKPGTCECGHSRSAHKKGKFRCMADFPPCDEHPEVWADCACQIYIRDEDDDDDGSPGDAGTPSPGELEELYNR